MDEETNFISKVLYLILFILIVIILGISLAKYLIN